jgi:hypothetical protein
VTIYRWCNGLDNTLADALVARERANPFLVVFGEAEGGKEVLFFVDMVCFDDSGEDGEAVLCIQ